MLRSLPWIENVWGRALDVLAVLAVALVVWKLFVAPRDLDPSRAHPAPHAVYQRLDGGTFAVTSARGRVVFLDFFASWCEPCRIEEPEIVRWSNAHPQAIVVPVDVGEPRVAAATFARRFGLGNVALDPQTSAQALFGVRGFPTIVVIDPSGRIRATWEGLNPAIGLALTNAAKTLSRN